MDYNKGQSNFNALWYGDALGSGFGGIDNAIPPQAIPTKHKDKDWKQAMMDFYEREGLQQLRESSGFRDIYRMADGELAYQELRDTLPQIAEEIGGTDAMPQTRIMHYDIIGRAVNGLTAEYIENKDKFHVDTTDEIASNEYIRMKEDLIRNYLAEQINIEISTKLIQQGIDPTGESIEFESPEQQQQYIQQVQQKRKEMTPPEIERFMQTEYVPNVVRWVNTSLDRDIERFHLEELDRESARDFFCTGRFFRPAIPTFDDYKIENWEVIGTFFSRDLETKYIQDGDYVGRIRYYSFNQLLARYGTKLTPKQKKALQECYAPSINNFKGKSSGNSLVERVWVPHEDYFTQEFNASVEDYTGVPLSHYTTLDEDGCEVTTPSFSSRRFNAPPATGIAHAFSDDPFLPNNLICTTEVYWKSQKKIGYLNYRNKDGLLTQEIVTEELYTDFLKEYNIKKVKTVSLEEISKDPQENTISWDYVEETWSGVKIRLNGSATQPYEDIYLDVAPMEYQIPGDDYGTVKLPVGGYVDKPIVMKLVSYQQMHNIFMNQARQLAEKEIGVFMMMDVGAIPSEFSNMGNDTEDSLFMYMDLAKELGMMPVDTSKQNMPNGGNFNQFTVHDLSLSRLISEKYMLADNAERKGLAQIGITPERLGQPLKYATAEGVKTSQEASFAQTEAEFSKISDGLKRFTELHVSLIKYCQTKKGQDVSLFARKSDGTKAMLKFVDPDLPLRAFGINTVSSAKDRKKLETAKQFLLQNNTILADVDSTMQMIYSDTKQETLAIAKESRLRAEQAAELERQHAAEMQRVQLEEQARQKDLDRIAEEQSKQRDRDNRVQVAEIAAIGRAVDTDTDQQGIDEINKAAERSQKQQELQARVINDEKNRKQKEVDSQNNLLLKNRELDIKEKELEIRKQDIATKKYTSEINKN